MTTKKLKKSFLPIVSDYPRLRASDTPQEASLVESRRSCVSQNTIFAIVMRTICFPRPGLLRMCRLFLYAGIFALSSNVIAADAPAVLAHAGCSKPNRDNIDRRIIEEVRNGTATYGNNGIITTPSDVGGWPNLQGGPAPVDSDHDGMSDTWEKQYNFNPAKVDDGPMDADGDGYTNVEEYLNGTNPRQKIDYTNLENNVDTIS